MKKIIIILFALLALVALYFLIFRNSSSKQSRVVNTSIFLPVLEANIEAFNSENVEFYMATMHEDSPSFGAARQLVEEMFKKYDLNVELKSWEVVSYTGDEIRVKIIQETKKIKGPDFKNNRITGVHTLKKSGDAWKIYDTVINNTEYFD